MCLTRNTGIFGQLTKAATADLPDLLDELTDGTGDGCVSVDRTRLEGVTDHVTIHANHAELIRAPLLYPDPGPVVSHAVCVAMAQSTINDRDRAAGTATGRDAGCKGLGICFDFRYSVRTPGMISHQYRQRGSNRCRRLL